MDAEIRNRDDLTDARTALERLSGLLPIELDLRRIGRVSLLPAKAAVLREVLAYRTTTLGLDAAGLIAEGRMLGASTLVRGCMEPVASLVCLRLRVERTIREKRTDGLDDFLVGLVLGSKNGTTDVSAPNVLTRLSQAEKEWPELRREYDAFSEFAHPNFGGGLASFGRTDWERGVVSFSATEYQLPADAVSPLLAALADVALDEHERLCGMEADLCSLCDAAA